MGKNLITDLPALAALDRTPVVFFPDRAVRGSGRETNWSHPDLELSLLLTEPWDSEMCFVQYHHAARTRLNRNDPIPPDLTFNLVGLDFDSAPHRPITTAQWEQALAAASLAAPRSNIVYPTHRGVRCVYLIEPEHDRLVFEDARMAFLSTATSMLGVGWKLDANRNWNAFFRAPRILYRQDGKVVDRRASPVWLLHTERIALPPVARTPLMTTTPSTPAAGSSLGTEAAVRWLATVAPAVAGEGGDKHTYWVICELVWRFRLDDRSLLVATRAWNARCLPPWSEDQLLRKATYARKAMRGG